MFAKLAAALMVLSSLGACAPRSDFDWVYSPEPAEQFEKGWPYTRAPNYPLGVWQAVSGFSIELRDDGTYIVCREGRMDCDHGSFERPRGIVVVLRDFNVAEHTVARELVELVNSDSRRDRDLDFTPNMGPPANAESCSGRPCVQLGSYSPRGEYTFILQDDGDR